MALASWSVESAERVAEVKDIVIVKTENGYLAFPRYAQGADGTIDMAKAASFETLNGLLGFVRAWFLADL